MAIIGTAGHVDHGKSTLVLALTGTDPDRLAEEKRRGMTIDLGFAHLDLPRAGRTGVVDVPGHARFLHNMLAGVHGMDVVLLVVAADAGVMPQTREHLDIIQVLGVTSLVVALSRVDLVDADGLELATADVREELARRRVSAVVLPVCAPTGAGLPALVEALDIAVLAATAGASVAPVAASAATGSGRGRLPIDRAFSIAGFGTVVTGTLVDGHLAVGQQVDLVGAPGERPRRVRLRGLQQHGGSVTVAPPGTRVAANLPGVEVEALHRGMVLAEAGSLGATRRFDGHLRVLPGARGLRHNSRVRVHAGTAEVAARVVVLGSGEVTEGEVADGGALEVVPGTEGWVQLRLDRPIALRDGDRFVLRRLSPSETLGGGEVLDAGAPLHRRGDPGLLAGLRGRSDDRARVLQEVARRRPGPLDAAVAARLGLDPARLAALVAELAAEGEVTIVGAAAWDRGNWRALAHRAGLELEAFHRRFPLRPGMASEELRERLGLAGPGAAEVLDRLISDGVLCRGVRGTLSRPGREVVLTAAQQAVTDSVLARLAAEPLAPPRASELAPSPDLGELLQYLEDAGRLVRVAPDLWLLAGAVATAREALRRHLEVAGAVTVAEARDLLGSTRKAVVPLLEHFDATHLTIRDGDLRRLRAG